VIAPPPDVGRRSASTPDDSKIHSLCDRQGINDLNAKGKLQIAISDREHFSTTQQCSEQGQMRRLMFGACLLAVAIVGFHTLISSALVAARDARAATFSQRFAPALKTPAG
jgi:hypothetical protein